jgi:hypothetical protein
VALNAALAKTEVTEPEECTGRRRSNAVACRGLAVASALAEAQASSIMSVAATAQQCMRSVSAHPSDRKAPRGAAASEVEVACPMWTEVRIPRASPGARQWFQQKELVPVFRPQAKGWSCVRSEERKPRRVDFSVFSECYNRGTGGTGPVYQGGVTPHHIPLSIRPLSLFHSEPRRWIASDGMGMFMGCELRVARYDPSLLTRGLQARRDAAIAVLRRAFLRSCVTTSSERHACERSVVRGSEGGRRAAGCELRQQAEEQVHREQRRA